MDYPYLERAVADGDDEIPTEVAIDEAAVRMECLKLVVAECKAVTSTLGVLTTANLFAAFVIHGTVPTTN